MKILVVDMSMDEVYVLCPWQPGKLINILEVLPF
jgi:hypothetical protein